MNRWKVGIAGAVFLAGACWIAASQEVRNEADANQRVILLKNGRVLRGQPTYVGDRCVLQLPNGGTIGLPVREITVDGANLLEVYQHLQQTVAKSSSVEPRLELVRWCLREGLLEQASLTLLDLMRVDPDHPEIEPLLKQIRLQTQQAARIALPKPESAKTVATSPSNRSVASDELELLAQSLPKPALAMFSTTVQPLLINRCGGSSCHTGNRSGDLRLLQPAHGTSFFRRMSLRNLHTVLRYVDWENPDNSPLLLTPRKPHGSAQVALIGDANEELYRTLREWIRQATQAAPPVDDKVHTAAGSDEAPSPEVAGQAEPRGVFPLFRPLATGQGQQSSLAKPGTAAVGASPPAGSPADPQRTVPPGSSSVGDPFDPAIFNRRFHGR